MYYPKRLIEVDLPIKVISENSRQEKKSAGHGHITTIHIWWARRPASACRAVICASLWIDPLDENCPESFRQELKTIFQKWVKNNLGLCTEISFKFFNRIAKNIDLLENPTILRESLLKFISEYSYPENVDNKVFNKIANEINIISQKIFDKNLGNRTIVVDPFSGAGTIPLEAARMGAETFASDLNPVAVTINKLLLEYLPKLNSETIQFVQKYGVKVLEETRKELGDLYPNLKDNSVPVAYLWARTIMCEGPGCGCQIPLIKSFWLQKKGSVKYALDFSIDNKSKTIKFSVIKNPKKVQEGTVKRGSITCPICGFTTSVHSVRKQLKKRDGGTNDARLIAVVSAKQNQTGRIFVASSDETIKGLQNSKNKYNHLLKLFKEKNQSIPLSNELPLMSGVFNAPIYGIDQWNKLYSERQFLVLYTLAIKIRDLDSDKYFNSLAIEQKEFIKICLGLIHSKLADLANSLCRWEPNVPCVQNLFGRQAIQMTWDYAEGNIFGDSRGSYLLVLNGIIKLLENNFNKWERGNVSLCDAAKHLLPDNSADSVITDPPYYNAVPYADLSDLFYLWHKISLSKTFPELFASETSPKDAEICEMASWDMRRYAHKDKFWFETSMTSALKEMRRILKPEGIAVIVFAHKSTAGWESMLQAIINAGWVITASWPIDTELGTRLRGMKSAALASSVHLVCRPQNPSMINAIGDWRNILALLPKRIKEWMLHLSKEEVVGADAIFACLGPALEIFTQYKKVEKASGEEITLRDYLEYVWAAISKEALNTIFEDADASGFEEDSRLTAMWLWTLFADKSKSQKTATMESSEMDNETEDDVELNKKKLTGYLLEYDTARKIAQGLGIHLENLTSVVYIKGDQATLLSVGERAKYLFAKEDITIQPKKSKKKVQESFDFMKEIEKEESDVAIINELARMNTANTTLDKLHQTMLLFAANRSEAMRRLLVEEGIGRDNNFWKLAQALSALYPAGTDEKRWVDGVLARKKGFGF